MGGPNRAGLVLLASLAALTAVGCATRAPRHRQAGDTAMALEGVPVRTFGTESCAAGSLSAVLNYHGDPVRMDDLDGELPRSPGGGVLSIDLLIAARRRGFHANLVKGDTERLAEEVLDGRPAILMLRVLNAPGRKVDYYHYVVVDGYDPEEDLYRFHFGDAKIRWSRFGSGMRRSWRGAGNALLLLRPDPEARLAARLRDAVALEQRGELDAAVAEYRAIVALDPASVRGWTNLGNALYRVERKRDAAVAYRRALELDPDDGNALNNLSWVLLELGEPDEAEVLARRATVHEAENLDLVLDTLGRILLVRGDCAEAASTFRRGLDWTPPHRPPLRANLLLGLAQAHLECGNESGARATLEEAMRSDPAPGVFEDITELSVLLSDPGP